MPAFTRTQSRPSIHRGVALLSATAVIALTAALVPAAPIGAATSAAHGDRAPRNSPVNGPIADSATTVVKGEYGPPEIAVARGRTGYHFLTDLPNGAHNPDFTANSRTILFWSTQDNGTDAIFSVPTRGGATTKVPTGCDGVDNCLGDDLPVVSPDGKEFLTERAIGPFDDEGCLAFVGFFVFHIDGTHARQVSPPMHGCQSDQQGRWSPNGQQIVFRHADMTGSGIWVMNRDGSDRHQLTQAGMDAGSPDWSPDGQRIAFQAPDEQPEPDLNTPQQLYTMRPDGSHLTAITHYQTAPGVIVKTFAARWSPDGRKILFGHLDATTTLGPDGLHHSDLFVMDPDGSHVRQINATPEKDNNPDWGPRPASTH
jgi:Tol biopolymer transport system component